MSEERNKNEDVNKLKEELIDLIDHRIAYNNGFTNLLSGDYSLFISLIFLILSAFGAWILGFLAQHYVLSVYLVFFIWLLYGLITIRKLKKREQEGVNKSISTNQKRLNVFTNWHFKLVGSMLYSCGMLFVFCIIVLGIIRDFRWWLWAPAIIFALMFLGIAGKRDLFETGLFGLRYMEEKDERKFIRFIWISNILFLAVTSYFWYKIGRELLFIILEEPYSIFEVFLTIILILISLGSLSEYLSMKFMVTEVSKQNYKLSALRMEINRIEDTEALEKQKKELLTWDLPKADSFLVFFNYYYLIFEEDESS